MFEIESAELGLHGGYESVLGVFLRDGEARSCFGGDIEEDAVKEMLAGIASVMPRVAGCLGVTVPELGAVMVILAARVRDDEVVRDDFADIEMRAELEELCDELGVEMPA